MLVIGNFPFTLSLAPLRPISPASLPLCQSLISKFPLLYSPAMRIFLLIWGAETLSLLGSRLTSFALGVWVFQRTGSATSFALTLLSTMLPGIILAPFAGVLVDRWNLRRTLLVSEVLLALNTLALAALLVSGYMFTEYIYIFGFINSILTMFQQLGATVAFSLLVPPEHLSRSNGLLKLSESLTEILAPVLGAMLILAVNLLGIALIDLITFAVTILVLLLVHLPRRAQTTTAAQGVRHELATAWRFILAHAGLAGLLVFYAVNNLLLGTVDALTGPLMLRLSDAAGLGWVSSAGGWGGLLGGLVMGAWGGPRRKIHGAVGVRVLLGLAFLLAGLYPRVWTLAVANGIYYFCVGVAVAATQAIWQAKVPPELQGRVLAFRRMLAYSSLPIAFLLAGPLADQLFEPALMPGGWLTPYLGHFLETGPGHGTALLFSLIGALMLVVVGVTYANPRIRNVEDEVPDFRRVGK